MERCVERTKENLNGALHPAPDSETKFCLVDPKTNERHLVREMTDIQLATFIAGVTHMSQTKLKAVMARIQLLLTPVDAHMLVDMFEKSLISASLSAVLQYEKDRRANAQISREPIVERLVTAVLDLIASKYEVLAVTGIGLRAVIDHALAGDLLPKEPQK